MAVQARPVVDPAVRPDAAGALPVAASATAGLLLLGCLVAPRVLPGDVYPRVVSDIAEFVAPTAAAVALALRAQRSRGRPRWTWALLATGCGCWAGRASGWRPGRPSSAGP